MGGSTISAIDRSSKIPLPDAPPLIRVGRDQAEAVFAVMAAANGEGVSPPGMSLTLDDALLLFDPAEDAILDEVLGVFGIHGDSGDLDGFVALRPLTIDGAEALEFYIFFRPDVPGNGRPLASANALTLMAREVTDLPIATLIYPENHRAKRFYARAGFTFDRLIETEGMQLELWPWHGNPSGAKS